METITTLLTKEQRHALRSAWRATLRANGGFASSRDHLFMALALEADIDRAFPPASTARRIASNAAQGHGPRMGLAKALEWLRCDLNRDIRLEKENDRESRWFGGGGQAGFLAEAILLERLRERVHGMQRTI